MGFIGIERVRERVLSQGFNSSHFVWLIADLNFFEASQGTLFSFFRLGDVALFPVEPLPKDATQGLLSFEADWTELLKETGIRVAAFIGIYSEFYLRLQRLGAMGARVGDEPWVYLKNCIPTGNSGKGVRSGRNQAIRSGLYVEEWSGQNILKEPWRQEALKELLADWRSKHIIQLHGFLNAVDPLKFPEERRYFILKSQKRIEGFLIASPVAAKKKYFLEDLILRENSPRGAGELLTLEAMVSLRDSGAQEASLGVVMSAPFQLRETVGIPELLKVCLTACYKMVDPVFNHHGLYLFRSRFKPKRWGGIYISILKPGSQISDFKAWIKSLSALFIAFKPTVNFSLGFIRNLSAGLIKRYGVTCLMTLLSVFFFYLGNHSGNLSPHWLNDFGFSVSAPTREWFHRSVISNFLYFNSNHFWFYGGLFIACLAWLERTHSKRFTIYLLTSAILLSDFLNYWVILKPIQMYQPNIFRQVATYHDVGSSLLLMMALGVQLCRFRRFGDLLFGFLMFGLVLKFSLDAAQIKTFVLNLNHILFLMIGYIIGRAEHLTEKWKSRQMSKIKPPLGRTVNIPG